MAAIGKIRSWGPWLVGIIGLALFGFIATDFTRSCETSSNQARQQVGEVMGSKLSIQDYQSTIEEYKNVFKQLGQDVDEDQLREFVWNDYVRNTIVAEEAEKLGLGVTDDEMKIILASGTHPLLQMGNMPMLPVFYNQQTGAFDYNNVAQVYTYLQQQAPEQYEEFDRYWKTVEKMLRRQLLSSKYMELLEACMLSNEASAKLAFEGSNSEATIELASLAYSTINDNDVQISDADLKAKYEQQKNSFKWNTETRDIKYAVCNIVPSEADLTALRNGLLEAAEELRNDSLKSVADILASHRSTISYHEGMPYNAAGLRQISPALFAAIDSLSEMGVTNPITYSSYLSGKMVDHMAVVRLNRRYQGIDSISYQFISVPGQSFEDAQQRADSLIAVIKGGQPIDSVAAKFGQPAAKNWLSANAYQSQETITPDDKAVFNAIHNATPGVPQQLKLSNQVMLYVVGDHRPAVTLYDVAIVSNEVRFSNDTYENMFNEFSKFLSECKTPADMDQNVTKYAQQRFQVMEQKNLRSNANTIGTPSALANTREAVKWAFAQASEGSISEIYQNSADGRFVAVAVTKVHPVGYLDQQSVEDYLRAEVLKDKKADMLIQKLGGAKTVAEAQAKGALVDTIRHITFPATVSVKGQRESGLSGAVATTEVGKTVSHVVKGTNGVFLFNVVSRDAKEGTAFDRREQENKLIQRALSSLTPNQYNPYTTLFDVLMEKAKVQDNRYQF
ncbi:MAG: SurA N-terminal domain-containing protein [Prevotella sp.]|nr:SurA N-terminal domain-containing protein [Prevotella sp.]